jgi:hypothetical protein
MSDVVAMCDSREARACVSYVIVSYVIVSCVLCHCVPCHAAAGDGVLWSVKVGVVTC